MFTSLRETRGLDGPLLKIGIVPSSSERQTLYEAQDHYQLRTEETKVSLSSKSNCRRGSLGETWFSLPFSLGDDLHNFKYRIWCPLEVYRYYPDSDLCCIEMENKLRAPRRKMWGPLFLAGFYFTIWKCLCSINFHF